MNLVKIRFAGNRGEHYRYLKLGPTENPSPPEREFQGGDVCSVGIRPAVHHPDCVDIFFENGDYAIEVPREFFVVIP